MTHHDNAELVRKAFDDWATGRGTFYDLLTPDAVWIIPGTSPHCGTWHGRDRFLSEMVAPFLGCFSSFSFCVRRIWADENTVAVNWESQGTDWCGISYANSYVYVIEMVGGQATSVTAFLDMVAFNAVWNRFVASA
jgi:ketosteroid isomerase-like protein